MNHFNSIKVRLKLSSGSGHPGASVPFQFHKGTIKTDLSHRHLFTAQIFQFHKGTIKTILYLCCLHSLKQISIP